MVMTWKMDSESDSDGTIVRVTDHENNESGLGLGCGENEFDGENAKDLVNALDRGNRDVPEKQTDGSNGGDLVKMRKMNEVEKVNCAELENTFDMRNTELEKVDDAVKG
jgi:hypothetical protein